MKQRRTYRQPAPTFPCDVCRRVHQNRCKPEDQRSVSVCVTLPGHVHRALLSHRTGAGVTDSSSDLVVSLLLAAAAGVLLWLIWPGADGRYAQEPSLVTVATAPDSEPVIAHLEEP